MQPLTESFIRSSFVNASRKEVKDMTLTEGFEALTDADWAFGIGLRYTFLSPTARPLQVSAARAQLEQARAGLGEAETARIAGLHQSL